MASALWTSHTPSAQAQDAPEDREEQQTSGRGVLTVDELRDPPEDSATSYFAVLPDAMQTLRRARSAFSLSPSPSASPASSPRLDQPSTTATDGFFSWSRWYAPSPAARPPPPKTLDEVARAVRSALRRRRSERALDGEGDSAGGSLSSSSASSLATTSSSQDGHLTLSPASSSSMWDAYPFPDADADRDGEETEASSLASSTSSSKPTSPSLVEPPTLRAARSAATLRPRPAPADKLLKRVKSGASLAQTADGAAEVAPHSPSSPAFAAFPSPSLSLASSQSSTFPPSPKRSPSLLPSAFSDTSPSASPSLSSSHSSLSFSTRLRRAASTATLRLRLSTTSTASSSAPPPLPATPAAAKLRDLLLAHDAASDPPPIPSVLPTLPSDASLASLASSSSLSSDSSDSSLGALTSATGEALFSTRHPFDSSASGAAQRRTSFSSDDTAPTTSSTSTADDPFASFSATAARHGSLAWLDHEYYGSGGEKAVGDGESDADDPFADAHESDAVAPPSPSTHYPPFDPLSISRSFTSPASHPPPPAPPSPRPTSRSRARVLTKQRSFVDPRTRTLRTAPGVVVTPSTPERGGFYRAG
ncbi:hypothetical protein JCM10207_001191 [Rhodosporidiobolus poonsookiae]